MSLPFVVLRLCAVLCSASRQNMTLEAAPGTELGAVSAGLSPAEIVLIFPLRDGEMPRYPGR